jgi:hypothetical protein
MLTIERKAMDVLKFTEWALRQGNTPHQIVAYYQELIEEYKQDRK